MKKKLISLSVAAAITAPAAALADATLYGKVHMSLDWFDIKARTSPNEYKGWTMNRGKHGKGNYRGNRFGIKGSEDLGGGLKAIYQMEFGIPMANEKDADLVNGDESGLSVRNSYIGLKGDFGTFLVGRYDSPLKVSSSPLELFNDTMADYAGTLGFDDNRLDNTIAYISPNLGGFQFAAATIPGSSSTAVGEENKRSDGLTEAYSLAGTYGNGPWYASAAYEVMTSDLADPNTTTSLTDYKKWRAGLGIRDLHGFYLSAIYEKQESINFTRDKDSALWQSQVGYAFGNNMIKGMYGKNQPDNDNSDKETKSWAFGFDHIFSKRTKAYALYTKVDVDNNTDEGDWRGFSLGMIHSF